MRVVVGRQEGTDQGPDGERCCSRLVMGFAAFFI